MPFRDHLRKQIASQRSKRHHIDQQHLLVSSRIACCEEPGIAESGIINQKIDIYLFAIDRVHQFLQLSKIREVNFPNVNAKIFMLLLQFMIQLKQLLLTSRDQDHRARTSGELPGEFAADPGGSSSDEDVTAVQLHVSCSRGR